MSSGNGLQGNLLRILFERAGKRQQTFSALHLAEDWMRSWPSYTVIRTMSTPLAKGDAHTFVADQTQGSKLNNVRSTLFSMPTAKLTVEEMPSKIP